MIAHLHVAGARPALVLLHGAGASHRAFEPLLPHLSGPEILAPSLPGREGSAGPPLSSVADMTKKIVKFVRDQGHHQIVVAGHSLGGALAIELTLTEPDLVCGLALVASGARLRVLPSILDGWRTEPAASDWRACDAFDRMDRLGEIDVPTRVIYGTNDPMTPPKYQAYLLQHITGAKGTELAGAGHDVVSERPAEVAAALMSLWSRFAP